MGDPLGPPVWELENVIFWVGRGFGVLVGLVLSVVEQQTWWGHSEPWSGIISCSQRCEPTMSQQQQKDCYWSLVKLELWAPIWKVNKVWGTIEWGIVPTIQMCLGSGGCKVLSIETYWNKLVPRTVDQTNWAGLVHNCLKCVGQRMPKAIIYYWRPLGGLNYIDPVIPLKV